MTKLLHLGAIALACSSLLVSENASATTDYTKTKYPIVLVHGIFGFNNFLGADYFYQIPSTLTSEGAKVLVTTVAAANSNEVRGEQLLTEVKNYLAATGAKKVNLIGHSQGSPTARYVAAVRPDLIASVTSVDGVNKGSKVADVIRKVAPAGSVTADVAASVANAFASFLSFATGSSNLSQNTLNALDSLTTPGLTKFNAKYPAGVPSACGDGAASVNGVNYYSWGGGSVLTNVLDPLDAGISAMSLVFAGEANDGLVSTCSQRLGKVLRSSYAMNHLDAVNGYFGIVNLFETDPKSVYREHANRLKGAGL